MTEKEKLRRKASALWSIVISTDGVPELAEPMARAECYFDRLTKRQQVTVAMIAKQFDEVCREIDKETTNIKEAQKVTEAITPDTITSSEGGD